MKCHVRISCLIVSLPFIICLSSCSSIPSPRSSDGSLVVLLRDRSPSAESGLPQSASTAPALYLRSEDGEEKRLSFWENGLFVCCSEPGSYDLLAEGRTDPVTTFEVPVNSVFLFQRLIVEGEGGYSVGTEVSPQDRLYAVRTLTTYVGFERWLGKEYVGFGPHRPKMYLSGRHIPVAFSSEPQNASLLIDGDVWGQTPEEIELPEGKYLVEMRREGYEPFKRIISVNEEMELSPTLSPREDSAPQETAEKDTFSVMVYPIRPFDEEVQNTYGDLFSGTIEVNFSTDPKLETVSWAPPEESGATDGGADSAGQGPAGGTPLGQPDFTAAEQAGVDLVVAGKYDVRDDSLLLEASLYEATSRRVKFAQTYTSETGVALFDSVDRLSADFAQEVSRVLPEPGEPIVEREEEMGGQLLAYEQSVYRRRMISERISWKHLLSLNYGLGGLNDGGDFDGTSWSFGGPDFPTIVSLTYIRPISQTLSFTSMVEVFPTDLRVGGEDDSDQEIPSALYSLMAGPEFDFRSETSDVYFRPLLRVGYLPQFSFTDGQDYTAGPMWYTGLMIDTGYRFFFYRKTGDRPYFMEAGLLLDIVEYRLSSTPPPGFITLHGKLYIGAGVGL